MKIFISMIFVILTSNSLMANNPPPRYMLADGRCLKNDEFTDLFDALKLSDGSLPYGYCDAEHFRIPDLQCKTNNPLSKCPTPFIRVQ